MLVLIKTHFTKVCHIILSYISNNLLFIIVYRMQIHRMPLWQA